MTTPEVYIVIYSQSSRYGFGEPLRVLCRATERAARMICSDERTHSTSWFLGWTRIGDQSVRFVKDDGRLAEVLEDLGLCEKDGVVDVSRKSNDT